MITIWKFPIPEPDAVHRIWVPRFAKFLAVQLQDGRPCIWAIVNTDESLKERKVCIVGTGHDCDVPPDWYLGTFQQSIFVWHVFVERIDS